MKPLLLMSVDDITISALVTIYTVRVCNIYSDFLHLSLNYANIVTADYQGDSIFILYI